MAAHELKDALDALKETGVRITPQRHAILEFLVNSMTHPTADDIYKALEGKFPNMSVATVYNNLRVFRESGLVKELTYGDSSSRLILRHLTTTMRFVKTAEKLWTFTILALMKLNSLHPM